MIRYRRISRKFVSVVVGWAATESLRSNWMRISSWSYASDLWINAINGGYSYGRIQLYADHSIGTSMQREYMAEKSTP